MSSENENVNPLEQALAGFTPVPLQLDRDRLMFLAGAASVQASGQPLASGGREPPEATVVGGRRSVVGQNWLWPAATATLATTSLALAIALFVRPALQPQFIVREMLVPAIASEAPPRIAVEREAVPPQRFAAAAPQPRSATTDSYLKTREVALRMGLDAIGAPSSGGSGPSLGSTYRELLEGLTGGAPASPATNPTERFPNM